MLAIISIGYVKEVGAGAGNIRGKDGGEDEGMLPVLRRVTAAVCLALLALSGTAAAGYQNGIPVLLYHHVSDDSGDMAELTTPPAEFDRQMGALKAAGFAAISPDELLAYMKGETVKLPDKPVVITFDDGYEDNYMSAFPILKKYGYRATVFMVGINFDRRNRLSTREIGAMGAAGFTVGAHSMTHPDLTSLDAAHLKAEVAGSKARAERATGKEAGFFAYPGGFYDIRTVEAAQAAGFAGAFTVLSGLNRAGYDDPYLLRRIPVFADTDFDRLLALLETNAPKTSLLQYDLEVPKDK